MYEKLEKPASAKTRLTKYAVKRMRVVKRQRAEFLASLKSAEPTEAGRQAAEALVKRVRAAKTASFLGQYRVG